MSRLRIFVLSVLLLSSFFAEGQPINWPPLPERGFVVGREATKADVADGNAVFVAAVNGRLIGVPLSIKIPQYAYYVGGAKKIPVIVIQAEEAQGRKLVGARNFKGQYIVGFISDFKLLGESRPK